MEADDVAEVLELSEDNDEVHQGAKKSRARLEGLDKVSRGDSGRTEELRSTTARESACWCPL
jgi:hypothetical protein